MTGGITVSHTNKTMKIVWVDPGSGLVKTARGVRVVIWPDSGQVIFYGEQGEIILNNSVQYVIT
jgi:hypothetical protein